MIIESLLDTDLYKLTMMQAVAALHPTVEVEYEFTCRNHIDLIPIWEDLDTEILNLCRLKFQRDEIEYLQSTKLFHTWFLDILQNFSLDSRNIILYHDNGLFRLQIKGRWVDTILFEVPLLAIINELYYKIKYKGVSPKIETVNMDAGRTRLTRACVDLQSATDNFRLMEFGTRRRFSRNWQGHVLARLLSVGGKKLCGTSNVALAMKYGITPMGTMAHEWLQAYQAFVPIKQSQVCALEDWMLFYRGELGIALTDCINTYQFCEDFDLLLAKAYDGVRHDSGDPETWGEIMIDHYQRLKIDSHQKTLVFSDNLTMDKAIKLTERFAGITNICCGIGTNLTNNFGVIPMSNVIKMTKCNGQPVAKITNEPNKAMAHDPEYLTYLCNTFGVKR